MKRLSILLLALILVLAGCGEKKDATAAATTATTTKETVAESTAPASKLSAKTSDAGSDSTIGEFDRADLTEDFDAKFASFKISKDWSFMTGSINELNDTLYFYFDEVQTPPFLMYQYELVDPSVVFLGNAQWDKVFENAGIKRLGEDVRYGVKFQYGFSENFNDTFEFLLYYTYDRGVLQAFAFAIPADAASQMDLYKRQLEYFLDTVVINEDAVSSAFDGGSSDVSTTTGASASDVGTPAASGYSGEFEILTMDDLDLPIPKGWAEVSRDATAGLTIGFAEGPNATRGMLYQRLEIGKLPESALEQLWSGYVSGLGAKRGDDVVINGEKYIEILPEEGKPMGFVGYSTYRDGIVHSFLISFNPSDTVQDGAELIRGVVEAARYR